MGSLRSPGDPSRVFAPLLDPGRTDVPLPWRSHRASPVSETRRPVLLATLQAERASLAAQSRRIETDAAPIRYVAELVGADTDNERANPVADHTYGPVLRPARHRPDRGGFGAAANRRLRPHLVHGTFDSCPSTKTRGL
jgi:hypothetical protein